jgi:hypothetical protein
MNSVHIFRFPFMLHPPPTVLYLIVMMVLDEEHITESQKLIFTSENDCSYSVLGHCVEWSP